MKNHDLYDARCAIIAQFGQDVASIPHRPPLRRALTTVMLMWQRWTSEDYHAHNEHVTMDWTGPLDMLPDVAATGADVAMAFGAAEALVNLDMEVLKR